MGKTTDNIYEGQDRKRGPMEKSKLSFSLLIITFTCFLFLQMPKFAYAGMTNCPGDLIEEPEIFEVIKTGDSYRLTVKTGSSLEYDYIEVWPALDAECEIASDELWECTYSEIEEARKNIVVVDFIDSSENCLVAWAKGFIESEPERPQSSGFVYTEEEPEIPILDQEPIQPKPLPPADILNSDIGSIDEIAALPANQALLEQKGSGGGSCSLIKSNSRVSSFLILILLSVFLLRIRTLLNS